tara:strand:+ start:5342 stop:5719 length:378 start_codon:yes stop_codon:yes gene_type:complete
MKVLRSEKAGRYILELIEEEHPWDVRFHKGTRGRKIFAPGRDKNRIVYRVTITNTAKAPTWLGRLAEVQDNEKRFGTLERAERYFDANYKNLSGPAGEYLKENTVRLTQTQLRTIIRETILKNYR